MASTSTPQAQNFEVAVDMGAMGIVLVEMWALTYMDAYKGAVEQMLLDPIGTMQHRARGILAELGYLEG